MQILCVAPLGRPYYRMMANLSIGSTEHLILRRGVFGQHNVVGIRGQDDNGNPGWEITAYVQSFSENNSYWVSGQEFHSMSVHIPLDGSAHQAQIHGIITDIDPEEKKLYSTQLRFGKIPLHKTQNDIAIQRVVANGLLFRFPQSRYCKSKYHNSLDYKMHLMKHFRIALLFVLAILASTQPARATKPPVVWQAAKLVSFGAQQGADSYSAQTNGHVNGEGSYSGTTTESDWSYVDYHVVLDDGKILYFGGWRLVFRWEHDPRFTENEMVKYYLHGDKLTVIDDTGKQIKMKLIKRRIKE